MIGAITTIASIAIGIAVSRPSSMEIGWLSIRYRSPDFHCSAAQTNLTCIAESSSTVVTEASYISGYGAVNNKLQLLKNELQAYESLESGWDGNNSSAPQRSHIAAACQLLDRLPAGVPLPKPMLSHDGEVGLYWVEDKFFADVVIENSTSFSLFVRQREPAYKEYFADSLIIKNTSTAIRQGLLLS
jgi:hypothetical protein